MTPNRIAITQGDPAGIGPEIIVTGWSELFDHDDADFQPLVLGHPEILRKAAALRNIDAKIVEVDIAEGAAVATPTRIPCLKVVDDAAVNIEYGKICPVAGQAAYDAIVAAIDLALSKKISGIMTAPIHKKALHLAGFLYPGHTELLAEKCGVDDFGMMLYLAPGAAIHGRDGLAVVHVTLHTAMKNVFEQITVDTVLQKARLIHGFMSKMKAGRCHELNTGFEKPRIGVCSLNPHAGENGLFGDEEIRIIRPAIEIAQREGLDITGPFPADTIMLQAKNGHFDAVVAMTHDQGHIALKLLDMFSAVNITLGLPILRTSVAHGTAFDIAGKGIANPGSFIEAVRVARVLADPRHTN